MTTSGLVVNGVDLAMYGFTVSDASGYANGLDARRDSTPMPGRVGHAPLSRRFLASPRQIAVQGIQKGVTRSALQDYADDLLWFLAQPDLQLVFASRPGQYVKGYLANPESVAIAPEFTQRGRSLRLSFTCEDPRFHDSSTTTVSFVDGPTPLVLGNAVCYPTITVTGPVSAPVITYGSLAMSFPTLVLGTGETLVIDCEAMTITVRGGSGAQYLSDTSDFIELDPLAVAAQVPTSIAWPEIACSPTPDAASITYRKAWR